MKAMKKVFQVFVALCMALGFGKTSISAEGGTWNVYYVDVNTSKLVASDLYTPNEEYALDLITHAGQDEIIDLPLSQLQKNGTLSLPENYRNVLGVAHLQNGEINILVAEAKEAWTVVLKSSDEAAGVLTGAGLYEKGKEAQIQATANPGYHFVQWSEEGTRITTDPTHAFSVEKDIVLTAEFAPCTWRTWVSNGDGTHTKTCVECAQTLVENCSGGQANCLEEAICSLCTGTYGKASEHVLGELVPQVDPREGKAGKLAHYQCTICKNFFNENFELVNEEDLIVEPIATHQVDVIVSPSEGGSTKGEGTYETGTEVTLEAMPEKGYHFIHWMEGEQEIGTELSLTFTAEADRVITAVFEKCTVQAATCTKPATCELCGQTYGDVDPEQHETLIHVEAKAPTHSEDGYSEYWYCEGCKTIFKDAAGTETVSLEDLLIPKANTHTEDGSGWHYNDTYHWKVCTCQEILDQAEHSFVWVIDREPSEEQAGAKHLACKVCGYQRASVKTLKKAVDQKSERATNDRVQTAHPTRAWMYSLGSLIALAGMILAILIKNRQF